MIQLDLARAGPAWKRELLVAPVELPHDMHGYVGILTSLQLSIERYTIKHTKSTHQRIISLTAVYCVP